MSDLRDKPSGSSPESAGSPLMQGFPPPLDRRPTLDNWDQPPYNRWAFQHIREILPTREVRRATTAHSFKRAPRDLLDLAFNGHDGRCLTVGRLLDESYTDGFLVLHRGRVVSEIYRNGMRPERLHLAQSVSKSFVGALAGIAIDQGLIDPAAPLALAVPELKACGYGDATLAHVLDMRSGVRFSEDYGLPDSDISKEEIVCGWKPRRPHIDNALPGCLYDLILMLGKERPHGSHFQYRSIETDVIAWVLERVTGTHLCDLMSCELWQPLGCEEDACFTVDSAGSALADGGLNATLRDFGRFGQMYCDDGWFNGRQILPAEFVRATAAGDPAVFDSPYKAIFPRGAYRNQFWSHNVDSGCFAARGVFGQLIYIDPRNHLVVVKLSTWPDYVNLPLVQDTFAAIESIAAVLTAEPD